MKSTLINMVAVLFTITLIASAGVGAVNMITVEPIATAKADARVAAHIEGKTVIKEISIPNKIINIVVK